MAQEFDLVAIASILIATFAASITLIRYQRESRVQREANIVTVLYDIVKIIDSDRAVESRGLLRASKELNEIRQFDPDVEDNIQIPKIDEKTQEAARYIATTYDRLGFILRHDQYLEKEILEWNGEVIADMWLMTRTIIKKKWRIRNASYAKEFERIGKKALEMSNADCRDSF